MRQGIVTIFVVCMGLFRKKKKEKKEKKEEEKKEEKKKDFSPHADPQRSINIIIKSYLGE